jgi:hypothetical protein
MRKEAEHQWQLALEACEGAGTTSAEFERRRKLIMAAAARGERQSFKSVLLARLLGRKP